MAEKEKFDVKKAVKTLLTWKGDVMAVPRGHRAETAAREAAGLPEKTKKPGK